MHQYQNNSPQGSGIVDHKSIHQEGLQPHNFARINHNIHFQEQGQHAECTIQRTAVMDLQMIQLNGLLATQNYPFLASGNIVATYIFIRSVSYKPILAGLVCKST